MRRTLTIKRENLHELDHGDLAQVVGASISCPINRLKEATTKLIALPPPPQTDVPTLCHCP